MVQLEIEQEKVNAVKAVVTAEQEVTDAEAQKVARATAGMGPMCVK